MDENLRAKLLDSGEIELALLVMEAEDDSDTLVSMVSVVVVSLYSNIQLNCFLSNSACQQKIANSLFRNFVFLLEYCLDLFGLNIIVNSDCNFECFFFSDFFLGEGYLISGFFYLNDLFWFKENPQKMSFIFQKDFQSLMRRRRDRVRNHCAKMKKTTPNSGKLFVLQVKY